MRNIKYLGLLTHKACARGDGLPAPSTYPNFSTVLELRVILLDLLECECMCTSLHIVSVSLIYRKSGNFRCKNIFVVDRSYEN